MPITLDSLNRTHDPKPPRIIVHGPHGVGKTTLLTSLPAPVVIQTEDGLGLIDVPHFPLARSFGDVIEALGAVYDAEEFKSVIIDSLDHLEPLVWAETCRRTGTNSIEDAGYGKGYIEADKVWAEIRDAVNALRDVGKVVAFTAHSQIKTFNDPEMAPYDRYEMKLHKRAASVMAEVSDLLLFANFDTATTEVKGNGLGDKRTIGKGVGSRSLYAEKRPAFEAKNRFKLPAKTPLKEPFDWSVYGAAFPNDFFTA